MKKSELKNTVANLQAVIAQAHNENNLLRTSIQGLQHELDGALTDNGKLRLQTGWRAAPSNADDLLKIVTQRDSLRNEVNRLKGELSRVEETTKLERTLFVEVQQERDGLSKKLTIHDAWHKDAAATINRLEAERNDLEGTALRANAEVLILQKSVKARNEQLYEAHEKLAARDAKTEPMTHVWNDEDSKAAIAEGWDLDERVIVHLDTKDRMFATDQEAFDFVLKHALAGLGLHRRALAIHLKNPNAKVWPVDETREHDLTERLEIRSMRLHELEVEHDKLKAQLKEFVDDVWVPIDSILINPMTAPLPEGRFRGLRMAIVIGQRMSVDNIDKLSVYLNRLPPLQAIVAWWLAVNRDAKFMTVKPFVDFAVKHKAFF